MECSGTGVLGYYIGVAVGWMAAYMSIRANFKEPNANE